MKTTPRRSISADFRSRGARKSRLRLSLHLMIAAAAAGGCIAPEPMRVAVPGDAPEIGSTEPLNEPPIQPLNEPPTVSVAVAEAGTKAVSPPDRVLNSQVVSASHIVPAAQVEFELPETGDASRRGAATVNTGAGERPEPLATQSASSPQPVERFVARALQAHPRVAAARLRVAAASQRIPQAGALPDPMWNNTFWPIPDNALQTAGGRMAHQMSLSQQMPWPEKLRARTAIASREVEMARAELEQVEREIAEAVRLAYYELWYATAAVEIVEDNRALVTDLITLAETRYRTGGAQQDVLRAELEAERLEDELIRLRSRRSAAQADLGALLQQPLELAPEPVRRLALPENAGQLDQLVSAALTCNPQLRELAWQIARDRERERLACLQRYPDLQLGVGWSAVTEDEAISGVANGHDNLNMTLGVTLPIWREKINAGIREAAANTAATARTRDAEEDAIHGTIRRLLAEADGLFQQIELYRTRIIPRTERTLQLATADYRGERVDFFSLIDIYQELLVYQVQVARMEASLAGTLARLERTVGCPVDLGAVSP